MGMIKTDPSQTKAVVGLLSILAVAIVVTIVRISGGSAPPAPVVKDTDSPKEACVVRTMSESVSDLSKNPFVSPPDYKSASLSEDGEIPGIKIMTDNQAKGEWDADNAPRIEPLKFGPGMRVSAPDNTAAKKTNAAEEAKPEFTLLATVKSGNGWSAVIRTSDSGEKVVEVGDKLDGGFVVKELSATRAVLADGRDIIIAKRPRS